LKREKLDEALSEYQKAIEIKPAYAKGHFNLGYVYRKKGMLEEAIHSFQRALEIHPKFGEAHYNLALIYYEKQEFKLAIQHFDQAGKLGVVVDPKFLERLKPYR
jgi:superkiller protein 3